MRAAALTDRQNLSWHIAWTSAAEPAVDLGEVGADLSGRKSSGRQRPHDLVDVAQASFALATNTGSGAPPRSRGSVNSSARLCRSTPSWYEPCSKSSRSYVGDLVLVVAEMLNIYSSRAVSITVFVRG